MTIHILIGIYQNIKIQDGSHMTIHILIEKTPQVGSKEKVTSGHKLDMRKVLQKY